MIPELDSIGSLSSALLAVFVLLTAAMAVGDSALRMMSFPLFHALDRRIVSFGLGLNLVGFFGMTVGMTFGLPGFASVWLLCGFSCLHVVNRRGLASSKQQQTSPRWLQRLPPGSIVAFGIAALTLGPALCYPTGWDELVYHSELPRRWAEDGRPLFYSDLAYSGFPSLSETLSWLMAPIDYLIAPRLLNWCCWCVCLVAAFRLLRVHGVPPGSAVAIVSAIAVSPAVLLIGANCYVETLVMMNLACSLLSIEGSAHADRSAGGKQSNRIPIQTSRNTAILLGIFAGAAAAVKLTGMITVVIPASWFCMMAVTRRMNVTTWKASAALSVVAAFIFLAPFYLRPWLATGNPFYPYMSQWFLSSPIDQEVGRFHHFIGGNFGVRSLATYLTGPMLLASQEDLYDGLLGWQFLIVIGLSSLAVVLALMGKSTTSDASRTPALSTVFLAFCVVMLYTFWFLTAQQARFIVPSLVPMLVIAGQGFCWLGSLARRVVVAGLMISSLVSIPWPTAGYYLGSWETTFGQWTWTDYVNDGTGGSYVPLTEAIRKETPEDARLLLLFEHRGLFIPRPYTIGTPAFQRSGLSEVHSPVTAESLIAHMKTQRFTYMVMANAPIGPDRAVDWHGEWDHVFKAVEKALDSGDLELIWASDEHSLLQLTDD